MKINYELTKQYHIDFDTHYIKNSSTIRRLLLLQRFIVPIIFFLITFIVMLITGASIWYRVIVAVIFVDILWVVFFPEYFRMNIINKVSKKIQEVKSESMVGYQGLLLNDEGIFNISVLNKSTMNWSSIKNIVETEHHIFIFTSPKVAYIVTIKSFKNINEKNKFVGMLGFLKAKSKTNKLSKA